MERLGGGGSYQAHHHEKNRKRLCYLIEFDRKDKTVIKLVNRGDLKKRE